MEGFLENSHGARPVHLIITTITWIRISRLSEKNSFSTCGTGSGPWFTRRYLLELRIQVVVPQERLCWQLMFRVYVSGLRFHFRRYCIFKIPVGTDRLNGGKAVSEDVVRRLFERGIDAEVLQRGQLPHERRQVPIQSHISMYSHV